MLGALPLLNHWRASVQAAPRVYSYASNWGKRVHLSSILGQLIRRRNCFFFDSNVNNPLCLDLLHFHL